MHLCFQLSINTEKEAISPSKLMDSYYLLLSLLMLPLILLLKSKLKSHSLNKNYRLPPGPWTFPIIGSIHHLIGRGLPPQALDSLSRQYGGLMFLQLGELPTIVVSSREAAREIMKTHDLKFCTRPVNPAMKILTYDGKDIVAAPYGKYWREDSDNNNFSMENVKALIIVSHIALIIFLSFQSLIHLFV
jgi:Cytochrome P450